MAFFAGVLFAELDASKSLEQQDLQPHASRSYRDHRELSSYEPRPGRLSTLLKYLVFVAGIYLICLPTPIGTGANFPADWFFLGIFPPLPWWGIETTWRTWHTFGAILVVGSMRTLPRLRAPFESRVAQFLGRISFSLYLCHQAILRIILNPALHWTSAWFTGVGGDSFLAWILTVPLIVGILLLISAYMANAVDQKSIALGLYMERRLNNNIT